MSKSVDETVFDYFSILLTEPAPEVKSERNLRLSLNKKRKLELRQELSRLRRQRLGYGTMSLYLLMRHPRKRRFLERTVLPSNTRQSQISRDLTVMRWNSYWRRCLKSRLPR